MIKANPTCIGRWFWESFSRWSIRFSFHKLEVIDRIEPSPEKSLLLLGNHISWWDGFWPLEVNRRHFHKNYHVMMLEEELIQRPFMRQGGAFSIQPGNRSMIHSLNYAAELLQVPENMVLIYPQGKIHSLYESNIEFASGINHILKKAGPKVQAIFFAAMIDFLSKAKPTVRFYLRELSFSPDTNLNEEYQKFYDECQQRQKAFVADSN